MISLENISIQQGAFALWNVNLSVPDQNYGVLMGPTGCGKTTLLEIICGLRPIRGGRIVLGGRDVTHARPADRGVGYVPQDGAMFPTMTVGEHLAFGLLVRRRPHDEIAVRVNELARWLGLEQILQRRPLLLSGGEKQRVAIGRALAVRPSVLLFDEPMSALDDGTRGEMYKLLAAVRRYSAVTVLHVTHSKSEAGQLADRLFVMGDGAVREVPSPQH